MRNFAMVATAALYALWAPTASAQKGPEIILVHGAFEDASVWDRVAAALRTDGYPTTVVDLPGRPSNPAPPLKMTLDRYTDTVASAVKAARGRVILVGHSFGGIVISSVADAVPGKVKTLVYVAALLPRDGDTLLSLAQSDPGSEVGQHLYIDNSKGIASIPIAARADLFANDGTPEERAAVTKAIVDEPLVPLAQPVRLHSRLAQVDKVYIHTSQDHVISPIGQRAMVAATPVRLELTLNTGHTPFLTAPGQLVRAIEQAAR